VLAHLGLGSNLGDRWAHLRGAVLQLRQLDPGLAVSPVYETVPAGGPAGQGPYLNCVVRMETDLTSRELLVLAGQLEARAQRVRDQKDGPRTLDVDVLLVGDLHVDEPDLVVPHPRMWDRAFVLAPLEDLDPLLVPAGWRERLGGRDLVNTQAWRVGTLLSG
jgi:2-amino-4-hydroxy-6-hydroxymethyldihydropteridine diphosphokinase